MTEHPVTPPIRWACLAAAATALMSAGPDHQLELTVTGLSAQTMTLSGTQLQALAPSALDLAGEHGVTLHLSGPTLLAVLQRAGALDPDFHHRVRQTVTATGRDGYSATVAMGEIDPEFENKAVILALDPEKGTLRLAIPGDKRLGRDVRDVVGLTVR